MTANTRTYVFMICPRAKFVNFTIKDFSSYESSDNGDDGETYVSMIDKFIRVQHNYEKYIIIVFLNREGDGDKIGYFYRVIDDRFNTVDRNYGMLKTDDQKEINKVISKIITKHKNGDEEIHEISVDNYGKRYRKHQIYKMIGGYSTMK